MGRVRCWAEGIVGRAAEWLVTAGNTPPAAFPHASLTEDRNAAMRSDQQGQSLSDSTVEGRPLPPSLGKHQQHERHHHHDAERRNRVGHGPIQRYRERTRVGHSARRWRPPGSSQPRHALDDVTTNMR